ncbi:MAG TPA: DUF2950 family protein [Bryobacteraceae bacterium]|nr:DUF2950 family protein [Bryobacteraceae bacterium]
MNPRTGLLCGAVCCLLGSAVLGSAAAFAQEPGQKTFASPAEAAHALANAVAANNEQALAAILGNGVLSPDKEAARLERQNFTQKYNQMHRLLQEQDGAMLLYIGAENWPFPVPLVSNNGRWFFDSQAGKQEILYRSIGENEITAMDVADAFTAARKRSARKVSTADPAPETAERLAAAPPGTEESFSGYNFRVAGKGGVALVAYPAEYRVTGVTTFVLTNDGKLYEKDLGKDTAQVARRIQAPPDSGWHPVR